MWFSYFITWEQRKLGELGKAQSGIGFPDKEQGGKNGIPFFKVSDMNNLGNELEMHIANNYVSLEQIKKNGWSPIEETSVIFAKVGAAIMLNRKRLVRFPFLLDNNTMAYKFNDAWEIDFGRTLFERIDLTSLVQVGALPSYNAGDVENMEVAIPQKAEQAKLGALFTSLDNLITLHQRKYEKFINIKKALLEKMFPQGDEKVPRIRFKGFTDAWEQRKLKQVATIQKGEQLSKAKLDSVGKYYVLNGGMEPSGFCDDYNTEPNTISISEGGNSCGYVALNLDRFWSGGHNYTLQNLRIDTEFLFQYLKGIETKIMALRVGSGLPNIQRTAIDGVDIAFPLSSEQKSIGQFLGKLSNLITLHQCKDEANFNPKSPLIFQLEDGCNVFAWEQRKFAEVYSLASEGGTPDTNIDAYYLNGTIPFVRIEDTENKYIDSVKTFITEEGLKHSSAWLIPSGSVIFTNGATVGNVAINRIPVATKQGILGIIPNKTVTAEYLYYLLSAGFFQREIRNRQATGTFATIILKNLNEINVFVPDKLEQRKISDYLSSIDNLITLHQCGENIYNRRQTW